MALAHHSPGSSQSPAAKLDEAVWDFQKILTEEQLKTLKEIKSIPDADAVLVFTAQLDGSQNRKGRSIATRLHPVLQSVRDFSAVIDTFVSSNPKIAALIWGSIKLTIQVRSTVQGVDAIKTKEWLSPNCLRLLSTMRRIMMPSQRYSWDLHRIVHGFPRTRLCTQAPSDFKERYATFTHR